MLICFVTNASGHHLVTSVTVSKYPRIAINDFHADTIIPKRPDTPRYRGLGADVIYTMDINAASKHVINVKDVTKHIGNEVAVEGKVFGYSQKKGYIDVYMGDKYPNNPLLVILAGKCQRLATRMKGKTIRVIGGIQPENGSKASIHVLRNKQVVFL